MSTEKIEDDDLVGLEEEGELLPNFEHKYKTQMRQIVTQRLDLPISTLPAMLKEQIKINPEFQRRDRWDEQRQSRLIESLLMNVPIPPVFLGEDEYGFYVVLDGRQRLTSIRNFLNNTLRLTGLSVWDDLNGLIFEDLVKRGLDKHLTRRFVSAIAILKESSSVVKYDVFDRLNTGGVKANEMEVRNAIFRGPFTDNMHELSRIPQFCDLFEIPQDRVQAESNGMYKKMSDLAVVLRFFALSNPQLMDGPFRDYLGDFMKGRNDLYKESADQKTTDEVRFRQAVINSWKVFGKGAFRNTAKEMKGPRSIPLAEAVMIALADFPPEAITSVVAARITASLNELFCDNEFLSAISSGTNGKGAILKRVGMARAAFSEAVLGKTVNG
jgi:Protein of unknown function DUF262